MMYFMFRSLNIYAIDEKYFGLQYSTRKKEGRLIWLMAEKSLYQFEKLIFFVRIRCFPKCPELELECIASRKVFRQCLKVGTP